MSFQAVYVEAQRSIIQRLIRSRISASTPDLGNQSRRHELGEVLL